ncbi:uncharacterized protein N7473_011070 [Penicillium subrubescens]|uniref:uncharacterized protein n=1 Tax=Penicillium subrubescens TaxID=1316194 RepID=UPI002545A29A|nr:uncharacterized protein N7473_011070 [Penicillium subrubescens]KAJ5882808.1 hypothetical protein N7473_011070 [Penicillium subrubescens]
MARLAVTVLLKLRSGRSNLAQICRSQDATIVRDRCLELRSLLHSPPQYTELEKYARALSSMLMENYSKIVTHDLSYATRLKLALIVRRFDDPKKLRAFLESPIKKTVWFNLHADYLTYTHETIPYNEFIDSFDFLLLPQSSLLRQASERRPSPGSRTKVYHPPRAVAKWRTHDTASLTLSSSTNIPSPPSSSLAARPTLPPIRDELRAFFPDSKMPHAATLPPSPSTVILQPNQHSD